MIEAKCLLDEESLDAPQEMKLLDLINMLQNEYDSLPDEDKAYATVDVGAYGGSGALIMKDSRRD